MAKALNYWFYPQEITPTLTLTFDTAGHLVENSDIVMAFNQQAELTKGGTRLVESYGPKRETFMFTAIVHKDSESFADVADVRTFLSTIQGARDSFVWRDETGTDRIVRMMTNPIVFQYMPPDHWKFTVDLEAY